MTIKEFKIFPYFLKFITSFEISNRKFSYREGFIISMSDESGNSGIGECAPLPGFSYEEIDEVKDQLRKLSISFIDLQIDDNISSIESFLNAKLLYPSVKFGIEQGFLNLLLGRVKNFFKNNFESINAEIPVNAVFGISDNISLIEGIEKKLENGYSTFKIKIGKKPFEEDFRLIESVRKYFGNDIKIRLDVNGAWTYDEALDNLKRIEQFKIEYIEEPSSNLEIMDRLAKKTNVPAAADESIGSLSEALDFIKSSGIKFFVIKPMILDGIFSTIKLIEEAKKYNKKIVISSAFESNIGLSALAFLAALNDRKYAHGLDTGGLFEKNTIKEIFEILNGTFYFESQKFPITFNPKEL